jgi:hypothetical protein
MAQIIHHDVTSQIWRAMSALTADGAGFTADLLRGILGPAHWRALDRYFKMLLREDIVRASGRGRYHVKPLAATAPPPLVPTANETTRQHQQQVWSALRMLAGGTPHDIALHASTDSETISEKEALVFCQALEKTGYLKRISARPRPVYRLLPGMNSGPRAPLILRQPPGVYDINLMRWVPAQAQLGVRP